MMLRSKQLFTPDETSLKNFSRDGFLVVPDLLEPATIETLRTRFEPLFRGEFETGIYPDEWCWQEGVSFPDVTRNISNGWKSDLAIARLVLSSEIAQMAAQLMGWQGTRLGQDTIWMKPPKTNAIVLHQDSSYMDFLEPAETITCWVTLDDTHTSAGTIEYVPGSHLWPLTERPIDFFAPEGGYRTKMLQAAAAAGITDAQSLPIEVTAGSCVFHHGHIWHGSGPNTTESIMRRSIGIHLLPDQVRFCASGGSYIYGRYQRVGETELDESFFPILWTRSGYRTPYLDFYCQTGKRAIPIESIGNRS